MLQNVYWIVIWRLSKKPTYATIYDCPILVWDKIESAEDLYLLWKNRKKPLKDYEKKYVIEIEKSMTDSLLKEFEPTEYINMLKEEVEIELMRYDAIHGGNRMDLTIAAITRSELEKKREEIQDRMIDSSVKKNLVRIEKSGIKLPPFHTISMFDYYSYLNYGE